MNPNQNDFQFHNPFVTVSPGLINLDDLPNGKYRHPIIGDGNCLFRSICFGLSGHQDHYSENRNNVVTYILSRCNDFKDDIYLMHKKSVTEYVQEMRQDRVYGDAIMIIALCLSLSISVVVYQKDAHKIETCEYRPTFNYQQHVEIYLDLNSKHYECILNTPHQTVNNSLLANSPQDANFSSSSSAQTLFPKNNSTMSSALNSAASLTVKKNDVFQSTFKSSANFNPKFKAMDSSVSTKLLKPKTSAGASVAKKTRKKCPHGKQKAFCKECGGSQVCEHKKQKATCKDCGGSEICEHEKNKQSCKECADRCEHGKFKRACKDCDGSSICEHRKIKYACVECGDCLCEHGKFKKACRECGTGLCQHDKFTHSCLDCMSMTQLESKGFICKICYEKSTRNGVCKPCSMSFKSSTDVSIEGLVKLCLSHFFGEDIKRNYNSMIGGLVCKNALDGEGDCEEKAKGAYIDIPFVLPDRLILGEVDENSHRYYDLSCELARYDTLAYGIAPIEITPTIENPSPIQGRATFILRFNPHDTPSMVVPFIQRVRAFIQMIRNLMTQSLTADDRIGVIVCYMFYGSGNVHQQASKHAELTLKVLPHINNPSDVPLDNDIAAFSLKDLVQKDVDAATQEILVQRQIQLSSGKGQCSAMNHAKNPALKTRCSAATKKGQNLCGRHLDQQAKGKVLVLADDQ